MNILLLGASGEVGSDVVRCLCRSAGLNGAVRGLQMVNRRRVPFEHFVNNELTLNSPGQEWFNKNVTERIVDFDSLPQDLGAGDYQGMLICLGTTKAKAKTNEQFKKVDFDYIVNAAKIAKKNDVKRLALCSAQGANKNSWFFYMKVKGETEEAITKLKFDETYIIRPAMLLCDRRERRIGESVFGGLVKVFDPLRWASVETKNVALCMLGLVAGPERSVPFRLVENTEIATVLNTLGDLVVMPTKK